MKNFANSLFSKAENYSVTGQYKFHLEVSINGQLPYHNCTLSIFAFSNKNKKNAIGVVYKWFREKENRSYQLIGIQSNTYQVSAQDIGSNIKVEVNSQDDDFYGLAFINFGRIILAPPTKSILEGILNAGGTRFPIISISDDYRTIYKESASLLITSDFFRIVVMINGKEKLLKFKFSLEIPFVELNYLETTKLVFVFKSEEVEEYENIKQFLNLSKKERNIRLCLKMVSRNSRDLVMLSMRCFAAKNYLINSKLISNLELFSSESKLFGNEKALAGDLLLEIESLKKELNNCLQINKDLQNDKESYNREVKRLEDEINETIEQYTKLITNINRENNIDSTTLIEISNGKKEELNLRKYLKKIEKEKKDVENLNKKLLEEIEVLQNFKNIEGYFSEKQNFNSNIRENGEEIKRKNSKMNNIKKEECNFEKKFLGEFDNQNNLFLKEENEQLKGRNVKLEKKLEKYSEIIENFENIEEKYNKLIRENESNNKFKSSKNDQNLRIIELEEQNEKLNNENINLKSRNAYLSQEISILEKERSYDNKANLSGNNINNKEIEDLFNENEWLKDQLDNFKRNNKTEFELTSKITELLTENNYLKRKSNKNEIENLLDENTRLKRELKETKGSISNQFGFKSNKLDENSNQDYKMQIEDLIGERNQLYKKIESLQKELEKKAPPRDFQLGLDQLGRTNMRLTEENQKLIESIKDKDDVIFNFKNNSTNKTRNIFSTSLVNNYKK